jgi:hypothetical protein
MSNFKLVFALHQLLYIVTYMSDSRQDFGLEIVFIDHFNTRLVITLNYSAIADLHAF